MRTILRAAALVAGLALWAAPAHAATFVVDTTADAADVLPGDGICASAAFGCSLRAAIQEANGTAGADSIVLPAGTYTLSLAGAGEDMSASGDLDVVIGGLTITGAGAGSTVIDAAGIDRVLHVSPDAFNASLTSLALSGVTVRGGRTDWFGGGIAANAALSLDQVVVTDNAASSGDGGGLDVRGALTIVDSTISGNVAGESGGGGLFLEHGPATITRTTFSGNSVAGSGGGAIYNWAYYGLAIVDSTISGNSAETDGGGGIYNRHPLTLTGSTVSGNSEGSSSGGGGIYNASTLTVENSTISGNNASDGYGGGIYGGTLSLTSSTVTANSAALGGGGLYVRGATAKNAIVAGNTNHDCDPAWNPSSAPFSTLLGHNLESGTDCGFDLQNASAMLGPLASNGGLTQTHALLAGSPAIDAGADCPPPATDQRGIARPAGSACDLGAYEGGTASAGPRVTISAPSSAAPGPASVAVQVTVHNDTPADLSGVSLVVAAGGGLASDPASPGTRTLGTLGAGESAPETFQLVAAAACANRTGTYSVFVDWDGNAGAPVEYARSVTLEGTCGRVGGTVSALGYGTLAGAEVDVCTLAASCTAVTTDAAGAFLVSGLEPGSYTVTAHPPIPSPDPALVPVTLPITVAQATLTTQNVTLSVRDAVPSNASLADARVSSAGVARLTPAGTPFAVTGCAGATAVWELRDRAGALIASGSMTESPSGTYTGFVDPASAHGWVRLGYVLACPGGAPADSESFDVYIDPSGYVYDAVGAPVVGATVTLFRADAATGPWTQVPDGSEVMSPANRTNPDLTDGTGHYGWDTLAGFYKVVATKGGCTVESRVVEVPPPVMDLDIVLTCLNAPAAGGSPSAPSGGGGGGGGAPAPAAPAAPAKPTPAATPAPTAAAALRLRAAKVTVRRARGFVVLHTRVSATRRAPLRISVLRGRRAIAIRPGSKLAGVRVGRSRRVVVLHARPGSSPLVLRLRAKDLRGARAWLRVSGPGATARVRLPR